MQHSMKLLRADVLKPGYGLKAFTRYRDRESRTFTRAAFYCNAPAQKRCILLHYVKPQSHAAVNSGLRTVCLMKLVEDVGESALWNPDYRVSHGELHPTESIVRSRAERSSIVLTRSVSQPQPCCSWFPGCHDARRTLHASLLRKFNRVVNEILKNVLELFAVGCNCGQIPGVAPVNGQILLQADLVTGSKIVEKVSKAEWLHFRADSLRLDLRGV